MSTWSIEAIKNTNKNRGFFWFSQSTMRFFRSRISSKVYEGPGGVFFVSSEVPPHGKRVYAVREFDPKTGAVARSYGKDFCRSTAHRRAQQFSQQQPYGWKEEAHNG